MDRAGLVGVIIKIYYRGYFLVRLLLVKLGTDSRRTHRLETSLIVAWLCVSVVTGAEEDCLSEMLLTRTFSIPRFLPVTPSLIGWSSPACLVSLHPIGSN